MSESTLIKKLPVRISPQPDETTCGPTCLHTLYRYYGEDVPLGDLVKEVKQLEGGGTLGAYLAAHALKRGYRAAIYTYNLKVFDPTWFGSEASSVRDKLLEQSEAKRDNARLQAATDAYVEFLDLGGKLKYDILRPSLIRRYLKKGIPLLAGLSATYLYGSKREYGPDLVYDDIRGEPAGHFVILHGYDRKRRTVMVADPLHNNPVSENQNYEVGVDRVINAILLGIMTYDANLIVLTPVSGDVTQRAFYAKPADSHQS